MVRQHTIYHYTDIQTLSLILHSRKIRFNRLDKVHGDVSEARTSKGISFGQFLFVSCWTHHAEENIPLWDLYTRDMGGVRIALPAYPFQQCEFEPPAEWNFIKEGRIPSPIPFDEVWTDLHFVVPMFLNRDLFGGSITYTNDIQEIYDRSVAIENDGTYTSLSIDRFYDLPRLKTKDWAFENEYRFVLFILPAIPIPPGGPSQQKNYEKELIACMLRSLLQGQEPPQDFFDVRLSPDALDAIEIVLGPCCSEGDKLIVESLLAKYTKKGSFTDSSLKGTIRCK